ncbi:acyl-CoA synthetase [Mycolicibacterium anyangense]|uniref:Acyl-CoA synthetase n=1 Tax=Mycolicibacterium anyangense TaxID=1431246 RepID=A0A6N4WE54_9MYCO|nr:acyl-CoA synthetase [Mycolicibacterium anyangense]BBZ78394.1 acyl-CoA synthetase [Mycolicibacterium anyangense]
MGSSDASFDLSTVFHTVATTLPDNRVLVWRDLDLTYAQMDARIDGVAHYLVAQGLGCHTERDQLQGHQSGQDHVGLYLRNGNEYLEAMVAGYRARVAPFNINYRYVEEELLYLLTDSGAKALVYAAEFAPHVASIRDQLPDLQLLIQVADDSGNELLPGAVDYESIVSTPEPAGGMPTPTGDDLYILYTGGTTGMPKGVLWRQHDIFMSAMGGRPFMGGGDLNSYSDLAEQARTNAGVRSLLLLPPLMHGAAQWGVYNTISTGGWVALPDNVKHLDPKGVLRLAERERVLSIPLVGDAMARPLLDEIVTGAYDLSGLFVMTNGGAPLSPTVRDQLLEALPNIMVMDAVGSSESGAQMTTVATKGAGAKAATFTALADTTVVSEDFTRVLQPGDGEGWLARRGYVPLGYLGDAEKTARTFPTIDGIRWSIPGDRANLLADGQIELLGRDSVTINSGGEKIFAEEVERAVASHPAVYDVVVAGRPSQRWGSEVVAIVQFAEGKSATDDELEQACSQHIAHYKLPKAFIRTDKVVRSPAGKADYRWAKAVAAESLGAQA